MASLGEYYVVRSSLVFYGKADMVLNYSKKGPAYYTGINRQETIVLSLSG